MVILYNMKHKLAFLIHLIMSLLNKYSTKKMSKISVCVSSHEIIIPLPVSIFPVPMFPNSRTI